MQINQTVINLVPTPVIRWITTDVVEPDGDGVNQVVGQKQLLQQLWATSSGVREWRNVTSVEVDEKKFNELLAEKKSGIIGG